jgi:hypothetical protein
MLAWFAATLERDQTSPFQAWAVSVHTALGARRSRSRLVLALTLAAGVAEGVAGNYIYNLLNESHGAVSTSVNGQPVALDNQAVLAARIIEILLRNGCLVAPPTSHQSEPHPSPRKKPR